MALCFYLVAFHVMYHLVPWSPNCPVLISISGRKDWSICSLCICLFILYALLSVLFFFFVSLHGLAGALAGGTLKTFRFEFYNEFAIFIMYFVLECLVLIFI